MVVSTVFSLFNAGKTALNEMKSQESQKETPKVTLQPITQNAGGVTSADSSGSLPRGRQQVYDSRRLPRPVSTSSCATQALSRTASGHQKIKKRILFNCVWPIPKNFMLFTRINK